MLDLEQSAKSAATLRGRVAAQMVDDQDRAIGFARQFLRNGVVQESWPGRAILGTDDDVVDLVPVRIIRERIGDGFGAPSIALDRRDPAPERLPDGFLKDAGDMRVGPDIKDGGAGREPRVDHREGELGAEFSSELRGNAGSLCGAVATIDAAQDFLGSGSLGEITRCHAMAPRWGQAVLDIDLPRRGRPLEIKI